MPLLDLFWAMLWFALFFLWVWLAIEIFSDIFRRDISGWAKAGWTIFLIIFPLLGAIIYLIANGDEMHKREADRARAIEAAQREYIRDAAGGGAPSTADELSKLAALHDSGKLTDEEFASQKAKLLA